MTKPTWNLDTREIGIRALRWLSETRDSTPDCPMGTRLSVLVGSWLCEVGLGVDPRARRSMASASLLRERLDGQPRAAATAELASCDSALVLVSALILREIDRCPRNLIAFQESVAAILRSEGGGLVSGSPELFAVSYLLARAGLCAPPAPPDFPGERPANLLEVSRQDVDRMSRKLAAATVCGTRPLAATQVLDQTLVALPIWCLYYLRRYDISLGAQLLRAMNYVGARKARAFHDGLQFLAAQQLPAGYFGFLGAGRQPGASDQRGQVPVSESYLPLTVTCLWTIAEATNQRFGLFRPERPVPARPRRADGMRQ